MTTSIDLPVQPSASLAPFVGVVRHTPFYFESQGQWLFAWLHRCEGQSPVNHGIILCPPFGHEQVHSHRSLRHLANALAQAGFPVVRFDYFGTGDSSGSDEDPTLVANWLANIRDASLWVQRQLGCSQLSLLGLRLGATLAAQATLGQAVDRLVLWAPVLKGRAHVREMKALSLVAASSAPSPDEASADVEAAGFVLTEGTTQDLSKLDLLQTQPQCRRALLIARDDVPSDTRLLEHFQTLGIDTEQITQPGYADMMAEPHYTKVPQQALASIVTWFRASRPSEVADTPVAFQLPSAIPEALLPYTQAISLAVSSRPISERALYLSKQPELFGILSEPLEPVEKLPCLVLVNAGAAYRVGPNRLHVFLARQLSAQGFRCLRLDISGLGDSVAPDSARENDSYPATAFRDVALTLEYLQTQLGVQRVVLMGLCSGAYVAFQAAAQFSNPALVESILINPLTFYWKDGMSLEAAPTEKLKTFHQYMTSVWNPKKWLKFLSGKSKIGVLGAVKMLLSLRSLRRQTQTSETASPVETIPDALRSHPLQEDLPGDLDRMVKAGRHLGCFFARSDPGYSILTFYAKKKANELKQAGKLDVAFLADADHTFTRRSARLALARALSEHLQRRYQ